VGVAICGQGLPRVVAFWDSGRRVLFWPMDFWPFKIFFYPLSAVLGGFGSLTGLAKWSFGGRFVGNEVPIL